MEHTRTLTRPLLAASWRSWLSSDVQRMGPYWLQLVWTLAFCVALAVPLTIFGFAAFAKGEGAWRNLSGWAYWYGKNLVVCLTIGFTIHGLFELAALWPGRAWLRRLKGWRASTFYVSVPLVGVAIGWPVGVTLAMQGWPVWFRGEQAANTIAGGLLISLVTTLALHFYFSAKGQQAEAERRATEAQLRLLQAQMEPHFLFNTLANVQSLIDSAPAQAKQMLESFTDYLRATLAQLRSDDSTLANELALAEAYLQLMAARMAGRLQFKIDADAAARSAVLPPLLLQPLVENALHHGLEPKVEGGHIHISAHVEGQHLTLEVLDNGLGLKNPSRRHSPAGAGVALANLRERLQSRYTHHAEFTLTDAAPGTLARIRLPFEVRHQARDEARDTLST
jgi:two-component sensor histidine kinase